MKYRLLILLSFINFFIYGQTTTVIYELSPDKAELNKLLNKKEKHNLPKKYSNIINDSYSLEFTLDITDNKTFYKEIPSLDIESRKNINITKMADLSNFVFTSKKGNNFTVLKESPFIEEFLIELPNIIWQIEAKEKYILNMKCLKAKGEYSVLSGDKYITSTVEAWFSPDIPLPFGPGRFSGLPGLILELKTSNHFIYTAREILYNNRKIASPKKPILSEKEYLEVLDNIRNN